MSQLDSEEISALLSPALVQHCRIKSFLEGKKLVFRVLKSEEKFRSAEELLR